MNSQHRFDFKRFAPGARCLAISFLVVIAGCGGGNAGDSAETPSLAERSSATNTSGTTSPEAARVAELMARGAEISRQELALAANRGAEAPAQAQDSATDSALAQKSTKAAASSSQTPVYRFFNAAANAHFFTNQVDERDQTRLNVPSLAYEGAAFSASPVGGTGLSPVYRFYNSSTGVHFYTISESEKSFIQVQLPQLSLEGVAYYASQTAAAGWIPLYRFYLPAKGFHFYTASAAEADSIQANLPQYSYEGIGYHVQAALPPSWPTAALPAATASTSYQLVPADWGVATNATAAVATTNGLQAAIDWASAQGYGEFRIPAGDYLIGKPGNSIYTAGITLASNMSLVLETGAILRMAQHDKWNACLVKIHGKQNVTVKGGTLVGDRYSHIFTPRSDGATAHDEGHVICIEGASQNVWIDGVHITQATGDGILIVGKTLRPQDIAITNNNFDTNRRQGVSIVGGVRIRVEGNEIHHTNGTSPQFGIDIEPLSGYVVRDVTIRGNQFHHNRGGDVVNTRGWNVLIEGNTLDQGDAVVTSGDGKNYIDGPIVFWPSADQTIRNNTITMYNGSVNGKSGIIGYSKVGTVRNNPDFNVIDNNTCNGCGMYLYSSARATIQNNRFLDGYLVIQNFENAQIFNNQVIHSSRCWAYRFKNITGQASGNTYNGAAFDIPLSGTPWTGCWVN
jgi:poly(beta-D-mannuronate) C5 epimerase